MGLLNQLRREQLLKSEVVEKLKKIGSELRIIHKKLAKVQNRRGIRRFLHDEERARHLLFLLRKSQAFKGRFTFRVNKVRTKIKDAMKKLFGMRHAERNLRRLLAKMYREVRSKTLGVSRQFWKLSLWHSHKSRRALDRQQNELTSEFSRHGRARNNLRALKLLRVERVRLLRKLRNNLGKHAKELADLSGRRRTSAADAVARSRWFLSKIMTERIRYSNMLRDLQRIKKGMLLLTKRIMREHTNHAQEEDHRHIVWRKVNRTRSEEARLKQKIVRVGVLNRRLKRVRLKLNFKHRRSMKLFKKIEREIQFLGRQIEKSRG